MKFSALVLYDRHNPALSVDFPAVTDALLAGGVFLDELALLPYDAPDAVTAALMRQESDSDCVFVIADSALLAAAREAVSAVAGKPFGEEFFCTADDRLFVVIPAGARGAEFVRAEVVPRVDARRKNMYSRVVIRTVGASAQKVAEVMARAEEAAGGKLALHASEKYGCGKVELIYDAQTPKMTADEVTRILAEGLSPHVYAVADVTPAERLVEALKLYRLKLSTAESFTGGGVGRAIVRVPGASKVYFEGLNTYDSASKVARLGVSEFTLKNKGAVSGEVAYEMAAGLIVQGACDVAIATTGVAGPETDGANPVGLCYLAVGTRAQVRVFRHRLAGDRENITETAINLALFHAYKEITETALPATLGGGNQEKS